MSRTVSFHRLARQELKEAAHYYDSESPGLGPEFLKEIEHCIQSILDYPEAALVIAGPVRRRVAWRFPYAVLLFHQTFENTHLRGDESEAASDVLGRA